MRTLIKAGWIAIVFMSSAHAANPVWLPNVNENATGTLGGSKYGLDVNVNSGYVGVSGSVTPHVNTGVAAASGSASTTPATLSAPSNAAGFILMNLDTSTTNLRWRIGATSGTGVGQQLQPGRDTGFVPAGTGVSITAESGTPSYDLQWIAQ